jgi:tetratricopeptide (TPR) repeat protein
MAIMSQPPSVERDGQRSQALDTLSILERPCSRNSLTPWVTSSNHNRSKKVRKACPAIRCLWWRGTPRVRFTWKAYSGDPSTPVRSLPAHCVERRISVFVREALTSNEPLGPAASSDVTPEHEPPAEAAAPPMPARWPIAVALLNLTGLSLGYWYLGRRRRAVLYLAITAGLLAVAFVTDAARQPWLWRGIFAAWAVWMAFDGWRLARRHPEARTAPRRRPALVATAAVLAVAAGYALYGLAGDRVLASGEAAKAAGDCAKANARYDLVTGPFELTLSGNGASAEQNREYCSQFLVAVTQQDRGEFASAIATYREFLFHTPTTSLDQPAHDRIQRAHLEWAQSARTSGDYPTAVRTYRDLLRAYGKSWSTDQARSELAQTLLDQSRLLRSRFDQAGSVAVIDVREAMQNYQLIQKDFGDTEAAASVPKAIVDTFNEAVRPFVGGKYCEAVPALEYLVSMPANESAGVVPTAQQHHAKAAFECGLLRYGSGAFDEARRHFETVTTKYPAHASASAAGSASIAATIAVQKPGTVLALPPPLSGNTPGTIRLTFFNDSSVATEVLLLGPTAHRFVIPACPSCPDGFDNEADACVTETGKPRFELRLRPGDYFIINRDADYPTNMSDVTTIALRGAETYCLSRGPTP